MQNRVFFPQPVLDQSLVDGSIEISGNEMIIVAEARKYRVAEAVHIVREVTGTADPNDVVGKVKSKLFLEELGAEILEGSMIIGDNAYDVVQGWLGVPSTSWGEHVQSSDRQKARASAPSFTAEEPKTDEDLLARFIMKTL